jgi:hypothetical protein
MFFIGDYYMKNALLLGCVFFGSFTVIMAENYVIQDSLTIGQKYINFIGRLDNKDSIGALESLFSPSIKKVINSKVICSDREQLRQQMFDVLNISGGVDKIDLFENIMSRDNGINIICFEITFKDGAVESVISIIKSNSAGLIEEINEVFGEKEVYQWP